MVEKFKDTQYYIQGLYGIPTFRHLYIYVPCLRKYFITSMNIEARIEMSQKSICVDDVRDYYKLQ